MAENLWTKDFTSPTTDFAVVLAAMGVLAIGLGWFVVGPMFCVMVGL